MQPEHEKFENFGFWKLTWSIGSVNSENALPSSRPHMKSSNLSVKPVDLMEDQV